MIRKKLAVFICGFALLPPIVSAIEITEIMYHPQSNEAQNEWIEIYNETSSRRDLGGWKFAEGIDFVFPEGMSVNPGQYVVIARDPAHIEAAYGITNVMGPFTGRLENSSDHVILYDNIGGVRAEVDYEDGGKWPVAADGAGHSLAKWVIRGDPMDPDNWRPSVEIGGTPGRYNGFDPWFEDTVLIEVGENWRYFKGVTEASSPVNAWRQVGFDDSGAGWLVGATGIGYGDGDDATVLGDMRNNYLSIYCRKTFTLADPASIDHLILEIDHDDGFVAYLNGSEVGRASMPGGAVYYNTQAASHEATAGGGALTVRDITAFKSLLTSGTNVLAVQVHNTAIGSSDLSFIPRLFSRTYHDPGQLAFPVVINEVRFHTSGTQYVELYNTSPAAVDIGGFYLSNDPDNLALFQITSPTVVAGNGHVAFLDTELGFAMTAAGDRVLFTSPGLNVVINARAVEAGPLDMTEGRWPDGAEAWFYMEPTTGTANAVALTTSVVINEIMYHPPSDDLADEYVEIHNAGAAAVDLTGWRFSRGITFAFTTGTIIAPGQYLVVARDRDHLIARYGLDPSIVVGNYTGRLDDSGEKVRLRDANNNVADEVRYSDGGHWSKYADGYGSSLELIDPRQDNANYQAWAPSDETSKVAWTRITYSGIVNDTNTTEQEEDELHFHLLAPGEVLVDDIHLRQGVSEYLSDNGFESGAGRWLIMGNHVRSHVVDTGAHSGSRCLKIVATGRGNTGANHIEQDAVALMQNGQTYTIGLWVKWQYGCNLLVTRCFNNQMPETHVLPRPANTGTPGAVNSVFRANLGPVFSEVSHAPVVPRPFETVTIRARAHDPDGVQSATVQYKADSASIYSSVAMHDDGLSGDETAGDGIYVGQLPAQAAGQTVAFFLTGADGLGTTNSWPADVSRPAHYRVESAGWVSNFPTYRLVMTAAEESELFGRPRLSNEPANCTFIFNEEDIYYNCGVRFTGSVYGRRGTNYRGFKVTFNNDEKLHGVKWQARFDNGQNAGYRDRISYHLLRVMGQPYCYCEWFAVRLNGINEGINEDILPPGKRYLQTLYPGRDEGQLFELGARNYFTADDDLDLSEFGGRGTTWQNWGNDKDVYRWNYQIRNHDRQDDYTTMIAAIQVYNRVPSAVTVAEIDRVIDRTRWLGVTAVRTVNADWDFRGVKNAHVYFHPTTGRMELLAWDCELGYNLSRVDMDIWSNAGTKVRQYLQMGGHAHHYLNEVHRYMATYFNHTYLDTWIDHYYSVVGGYNPNSFKSFIDSRRAFLDPLMAPYVMPRVTIAITTSDPLTVPRLRADLAGTAPVNASWVRYRGWDYRLEWINATRWYVTITVPPGSNLVTLEFLDYDKQTIGWASITVHAPVGSEIEAWKAY